MGRGTYAKLGAVLVVAASQLVLATGVAHASPASVSVVDGVLRYQAAPGQENRVGVDRQGAILEVRDVVALVAGPGCFAGPQATVVRCLGHAVRALELDTSDQQDALGVDPEVRIPATLRAGAGDDYVQAGSAPYGVNRLDGGPGADTVVGGPDRDILDGGPGRDLFHGGAGVDTLTYERRIVGVQVNLGFSGGNGEPGEGDQIGTGLENLVGGSGPDRLTGNAGPNSVHGGKGNDFVFGLAGDDKLFGDAGFDQLFGGDGDDTCDIGTDGGRAGCETVIYP
jgi:Ca2+-binding RTX toxin-like protein